MGVTDGSGVSAARQASVAAATPRSSNTSTSGGNLFPRLWPLAAVSWLPLLASPLNALIQTNPSPTRLFVSMLLVTGFIALYVALVLRRPFAGPALATAAIRWRLALLAALAIVGLTLYPLFGTGIPPWYLVYATIAAGVALPARLATYAVTLVAAVTMAATIIATGWGDAVAPTVGLIAIGISTIAAGRLVNALDELRAAREELAHLAVAEERLRFARDLHDLLGHTLSLIVLKSELARELTAVAPERVAQEVGDIERAAREALQEVRSVVVGYRQPSLEGELTGARELLAAAGIDVQIQHASGILPLALDTTLAWAVREGITNVIRHSRAHGCLIRTARLVDEALIEITDDGTGVAGCPTAGGSGLAGLRERIVAHGGQLAAGPHQPSGYRLSVTLPLHDTAEGSNR